MVCNVHTDREAIGTCTTCGKAICGECAVDLGGKLSCRDCLARGQVNSGVKDPNTAFLIELIGGFFGLLGIGYLYVGRTNDGIIRLVAWLAYIAVAWIAIGLLSVIVIGVLCIPVQIIIQIGVPIWSALSLKNQLEGKPAPFSRQ